MSETMSETAAEMLQPRDGEEVEGGSNADADALPNSMIARVAKVLSAFGPDTSSLGVSELARLTHLPKSTVSRIANELAEHQFLERKGDRLMVGMRMFELGELAPRPQSLRRFAVAAMTDLRQATGHTVHLATLQEVDVVYVEILHSRTSPRLPSRVGGRMPAYATAVGKALLAYSPESVIEKVVAEGFRKFGPGTIAEEEVLRDDLLRIRASGLSIEREESGSNIACAAAPVFDAGGQIVAAISASGYSNYFQVSHAGPAVQTAALGLNRRIKSRSPSL